MAAKLLITLILLSLLYLSFASPILRAVDILSNSGFLSMSLTLQLVSKTFAPNSCLTIFSPSDSAFASSGQLSLSILKFHFSPVAYPFLSLQSLPSNSRIPTFFPNHSLVVTSLPSDCNVSLNGVRISSNPIYDDGSLIIFGIDEFFNPGYRASGSFEAHNLNFPCGVSFNETMSAFNEAKEVLKSKGHSFMAAFLELQLLGFKGKSGRSELTVFAPNDRVMMDYVGNVNDYSTLFLRHILPCKISWNDLVGFDDNGVVLKTFLDGFKINVTKSDDVLMLNGVVIGSPDLYYSDWLVVHGIREILAAPERSKEVTKSSDKIGSKSEEIATHHGEF